MPEIGRTLMLVGGLILVVGALLTFGSKIPWLGRLPGDIVVERPNFSFYFPLTTSIVISAVLSIIWLIFRK